MQDVRTHEEDGPGVGAPNTSGSDAVQIARSHRLSAQFMVSACDASDSWLAGKGLAQEVKVCIPRPFQRFDTNTTSDALPLAAHIDPDQRLLLLQPGKRDTADADCASPSSRGCIRCATLADPSA